MNAGIAALLALCAALISAYGSVIRQRSAQEISDRSVGHLELIRMSLHDRRWRLGAAAAVTNYGFLAAALGIGSVVLVTALQVTALLFALPIYARVTHRRLTPWEWIWATLLVAALAVFVLVGDPTPGEPRASLNSWIAVAAVTGPLLMSCVLGARIWPGRPLAAVLLAIVAGTSSALLSVLTKGVVSAGEAGPRALLRAPELYAFIPVAVIGLIFQQSSFRAGALTASMPAQTVTEPVVASALGVIVLGETLGADGPKAFILGAAGAVVVVATWALARGKAATIAARRGGDLKIDTRPAPRPA